MAVSIDAGPLSEAGARVESFAPVEPVSARLLILGSMPGVASLKAQQYYAHPRNQFWPLMAALFGVPTDAPYAERLAHLTANGVALWDVLKACERPGSLDSSIVRATEVPNDFAGFLDRHPMLRAIALNGGTAQAAFRRRVLPVLGSRLDRIKVIPLPSTSPANAGMRPEAKRLMWSQLSAFV